MSQAPPDEFRELLFADVALMKGHAEARQVAAALLKYWDRRDRVDTTLAEELATIAGIPKDALAEIEAEVGRLVNAADDDPRLAVTRRGGLAHEIHAAVSRKDTDRSRHLTDLGAGIRVALRTLPSERYLDFMPVGEGGMGIVYWAMDTELGRQVAFKVVRPPDDRPGAGVTPPAPVRMRAPDLGTEYADAFEELKARFLQEAWVTGGMEHPGIVPVYELGATDGGVPYYTMRFVRGRRTLQTAIDDIHDRPFDERITLLEPFLKICDAISYAHNRGVVHRDLKPANVALGEYGETIVLDWGLAKLKGHPDVHASRWQARVHEFRDRTDMETLDSALGTPGYMAPEAAAGEVEKVDQLADIYSLGAILYEIVAGKPHVEFRTFQEYAAAILADDPTDPSAVDSAVPPALSALCLSALARDRQLRPGTVGDLAKGIRTWQKQSAVEREMEVLLDEAEGSLTETTGMTVVSMRRQAERATAACQRVLEHRPGDARANELLKRARSLREAGVRVEAEQARRTLLRRVAVIGLILVAVIGAAVAYVIEQRRQEAEEAREVARVERDNAATQRGYAEEAMGFIIDDLRTTLEPEGRLDVLAQIGEKARDHYAKLPVATATPVDFGRRMRALRQLGDVYLKQGELPKARVVFEEAAAVAAEYAGANEGSAVAGFAESRATLDVARVDGAQGYPTRARDRADAVLESLSGDRPQEIPELTWMHALVEAHLTRAAAHLGIPDRAAALVDFKKAHEYADKLQNLQGATDEHTRLAIRAQVNLATGLWINSHIDEAVSQSTAALSLARMYADRPDTGVFGIQALAAAELNRARVYRVQSEIGASTQLYDQGIARLRKLIERDESNFIWRDRLVSALLARGDVAGGVRMHWEHGAKWHREAYDGAKELHKQDPTNARWINILVTLCDRKGVAALRLDNDTATNLALREEAVMHAQKLAKLEQNNPRWRVIIAYTIMTYAEQQKDKQKALSALRTGRDHAAYAVELIPTASDTAPILGNISLLIEQRVRGTSEVSVHMRQAFDLMLKLAKANPDSFYPSNGVMFMLANTGRVSDKADAALWKPELQRQIKLARAWVEELRARGDTLPKQLKENLGGFDRTIAQVERDTAELDD